MWLPRKSDNKRYSPVNELPAYTPFEEPTAAVTGENSGKKNVSAGETGATNKTVYLPVVLPLISELKWRVRLEVKACCDESVSPELVSPHTTHTNPGLDLQAAS